jgi:hypothetical protein
MQLEHGHAENGPAALGLHQLKAEVVDWVAMAQPFVGAGQVGFR